MPSRHAFRLAALLSLALAVPAPARPAEAPPRATSFTVSGGASLGSYEAGFLYYMQAAAQVNGGGGLLLMLASGASAGSVNAMLSLVHARGGLPLDPGQSLYARTWLPIGFRDLYRPSLTTPWGVFARQALMEDARTVEQALRAGLPLDLDVVLAVAVTRVTPRQLPIAAGRGTVPRTEEKFVLRIQGRGPGVMPRITNYVPEDAEEELVLLPEDAAGEVPFRHVARLLVASAAFPVAFAPEPLPHCVVATRGLARPFCPEERSTSALFVDGGVFDNAPLRVAARVAAAGLRSGPDGPKWAPAPSYGDPGPPTHVDFAFLSADARAYPGEGELRHLPLDTSIGSLLAEEATSFVATARAKELDDLVSEYPSVSRTLLYAQRHFPAAGEPMLAFFGFLERSFREFDFTLGMYEARRALRTTPVARAQRTAPGSPFVLPEDSPEAAPFAAAWAPLACMRATFDGEPDAEARCAGPSLEAERILLQVSLDRLWNACRALPAAAPRTGAHAACAVVDGRTTPPRVAGVPSAPGPTARDVDGESEPEYVVRLLSGYGFDWVDMGYGRADADRALSGLSTDLHDAGARLAALQPTFASRSTVAAATRLAADAVHYQPPRSALWLTLGRALEFGGATAVVETLWLRAAGSLKLQNLLTAISSDPERVGLLPVAGFELVPPSLGSPFVQPSALLRAGYLFDLADSGCEGNSGTTIGLCSRGEVEAGVAAVFGGVLRVQVMFEWYPPARGAPGLWLLAPSMGVQFGK